MNAHHSHANLVGNVKIRKMVMNACVCQDIMEEFVIKVIYTPDNLTKARR